MAIYHCSIKIISRGKGKSAVAASAYRSGEKIINDYDGITHDFTRKGGIAHKEILLPDNAPKEYSDRSILWNAVEKIEKANNSQLAREIEVALPAELTLEDNIALVRYYVKSNFISAGMCADICIHDKKDGNPHAHIMLTMRPFKKDGTWGAKSKKEYIYNDYGEKIKLKNGTFKTNKINLVDWNEQTKAEEWRAAWADATNTILKHYNFESRVDHRSFDRQGIEQIPTIHMGATATQMERRGVATELGDINREIKVKNNLLQQLVDKIIQLKDWLKQAFVPKEPTLIKKIQSYIENVKNENPWQIIWFDNEEKAIKYLQENNISTLPELREKIYGGQKFSNTAYEFRELASILKTVESIVPDDQQKTDPPKEKFEEEPVSIRERLAQIKKSHQSQNSTHSGQGNQSNLRSSRIKNDDWGR